MEFFGKRSYHAKNVPSLLQATLVARNGIYHTGIRLYHANESIVWGTGKTCHYMQELYFMACTVLNLYLSFLSPKTPLWELGNLTLYNIAL